MKAKVLSNEKARLAVEARRAGKSYKLLSDDFEEVGNGTSWEEWRADRVSDELESIAEGLLIHGHKLDVNSFDKEACVIVHKNLGLPPNLAASDGFWRWLAVEKLSGIVEARAGGSAHLRNYGIDASVTDNRIAILWFRADMVYDAASKDPYHLAQQPAHTDFWESGIIRHRYAWTPSLARSLVRFQYRDSASSQAYLHSTHYNGVRELYKRMRRLHSTVSFEYLNDEELWTTLNEKSNGLTRA